MIQKVEILKLASKMAISSAQKTYLTNIINKNNFNSEFLQMLEVIKWCRRLKWKIGLIPRVEILKMASKMASKMAASNALKTYLTNKLDKNI